MKDAKTGCCGTSVIKTMAIIPIPIPEI